LLRRLEMCAKAREESTKIMSIRFAQRDAVKNENRREKQQYVEKLTGWQRDRDERWSRKLQRSPFAVDLVAENQRIDEENRVKDHIEQRRQRLMSRRNREAHNAIFKRATAETDELDQLRAEKRTLLETAAMLPLAGVGCKFFRAPDPTHSDTKGKYFLATSVDFKQLPIRGTLKATQFQSGGPIRHNIAVIGKDLGKWRYEFPEGAHPAVYRPPFPDMRADSSKEEAVEEEEELAEEEEEVEEEEEEEEEQEAEEEEVDDSSSKDEL